MDSSGSKDSSEAATTQFQGLDDLYKATLSDAVQSYDLPFPVQTVECYTTKVDAYETGESNSVLDLDKGQVQIIKVGQTFCDGQILQQYLNDASILRPQDSNLYQEGIMMVPEVRPPTIDDFDFNSSDSFSSTESIIPKKIECPKCPKRFMFKSDLTRHNKHKHSVKQKLVCNVCKKEFFSLQNLRFHEKSHQTPISDIVCFSCKKTFKTQALYVKHMAERHKDTPHQEPEKNPAHICSTCGKAFRKFSAFKAHWLKHKKNDPLDLDVDLKIVNGQQGNKSKNNRRNVVKVMCAHCSKEFSKSGLKQHLKAAHKTTKQESCTQTGTFTATYQVPNVNMVLHPTITTIDGNQSIILTNIGDVNTLSSLPIIIGRSATVPFSTAS